MCTSMRLRRPSSRLIEERIENYRRIHEERLRNPQTHRGRLSVVLDGSLVRERLGFYDRKLRSPRRQPAPTPTIEKVGSRRSISRKIIDKLTTATAPSPAQPSPTLPQDAVEPTTASDASSSPPPSETGPGAATDELINPTSDDFLSRLGAAGGDTVYDAAGEVGGSAMPTNHKPDLSSKPKPESVLRTGLEPGPERGSAPAPEPDLEPRPQPQSQPHQPQLQPQPPLALLPEEARAPVAPLESRQLGEPALQRETSKEPASTESSLQPQPSLQEKAAVLDTSALDSSALGTPALDRAVVSTDFAGAGASSTVLVNGEAFTRGAGSDSFAAEELDAMPPSTGAATTSSSARNIGSELEAAALEGTRLEGVTLEEPALEGPALEVVELGKAQEEPSWGRPLTEAQQRDRSSSREALEQVTRPNTHQGSSRLTAS